MADWDKNHRRRQLFFDFLFHNDLEKYEKILADMGHTTIESAIDDDNIQVTEMAIIKDDCQFAATHRTKGHVAQYWFRCQLLDLLAFVYEPLE